MAIRITIQNFRREGRNFQIIWYLKSVFFLCAGLTITSTQAQDSVYAIQLKKTTPYSEVFSFLENNCNVHISYPAEIEQYQIKNNIDLIETERSLFLKKLFFYLELEYVLKDKGDVLIRPVPRYEGDNMIWVQLYVKEKESGLPLPLILVHSENLRIAEYTDAQGWCGLKLKKEDFDGQLFVYSFNYEPVTINTTENSSTIHVELTLQQNKLPPITLLGRKKSMLFMDSQGILQNKRNGHQNNNLSIYGNDPVRHAQIMAGIQANDDKSTGLKIRGGAEEATLLVLDKTPVYKLDHLLGIFSAVNGDYYDQWGLYKNIIPVEYGGKTGGMFDFSSSESENTWSGKANINFLYISLVAKGYISKNLGIQIGFRKSLSTNLNASLTDFSNRGSILNDAPEVRNKNILINQPDFGFYDGQCKIWYTLKNHKFTLSSFSSVDQMFNQYATSFRNKVFLIHEKQIQEKNWSNMAGSFEYMYDHVNYNLDAQLYLTRFSENASLLYDISRVNPMQQKFDTLSNKNENDIFDTGFKLSWSNKSKNPFRVGFEYIVHDNILFFEESQSPIFEVNRTAGVISVFSGKNWPLHKHWTIQTNVRSSYINSWKGFWFLPQLALQYDNDNIEWQIGITKYKQAVRMLEFENFFGHRSTFFVLANQNAIPESTSYNSFSGLQFKWTNVTLLSEIYYRKTFGNLFLSRNIATLLDRSTPLSLSDFTLFRGNGRSYGMDIGLLINIRNWNQSFQYSLSKSENRFENLFNNEYFSSIDDNRHQLKILQGFKLKNWYTNTTLIYASGRPYTNVNQILAVQDRIELQDIENGVYQDRLPDYIRWDIVLGFQVPLTAKMRCAIEFSCFNLMNRANVKYRQFYFQLPGTAAPNTVLGNDITQLGRTYNLSATLSFNQH